MLFSITLIIFTVVSGVTSQNEVCPSGWTFYHETTYCYTISENYYSWDEAVNYCASIGGELTYISTYFERTFLNGFTSDLFAQPWLGTRRNRTDGKFYDLNGKSTTSSFWLAGEPGSEGDCVTYRAATPNGRKVTQCYSIQPALCRQMPALCPSQTQYGGPNNRSGVISSPGYPVQYYNNLDCVYTITSPANTYITLRFSPFFTQRIYDYVWLYDGNSTNLPIFGRIVTSNDRNDFESTSNAISFLFHTDSSVTDRGWEVTWNAKSNTPPVYQNGTNGSFTSPNYPNDYDPYTEQLYYITGYSGFQINLTITDFNTEARYDVLEIYSSSFVDPNSLVANLSGNSIAPYSYLSPSSNVTLRFLSDYMVQKSGWSLIWFIQ